MLNITDICIIGINACVAVHFLDPIISIFGSESSNNLFAFSVFTTLNKDVSSSTSKLGFVFPINLIIYMVTTKFYIKKQ